MLSKQLQIIYNLPVLLKVEINTGFADVSLLSVAASAPSEPLLSIKHSPLKYKN